MNNKKLPRKTTSAIILAIVLVTGTIAAFAPSFVVGAQAVPQYGMEREYGSYEQPEYGMDSYEKKSYRDDSYEPREYPYYKQDYETKYSSYGKDDRENSKKDSSTVNINKLNCINNNVNINGNNTGDINVGNSGSSATGPGTDGGYLGIGSFGTNGEGYGNDYKKGESFNCIINNNNINNNFDNETIPEPISCEECFTENLSVEQLNNLTELLSTSPTSGNLEGLCEQLSNATLTNQQKILGLIFIFSEAGITDEDAFLRILECLEELGLIIVPPNLGLPPDTNTGISAFGINTESLASSFSSHQIKGDSSELTALEKVEKLKKQWLELLP